MKNLNRNQTIAVSIGLVTIFSLFFSAPLLSFLHLSTNPNNDNQTTMTEPKISTQEVIVGQGVTAESGDELTVHYVGTLENGQVFDSSRDSNIPFKFTLGAGEVIKGWDEGLAGMRVGGKRLLTIPPEFGYGANAIGAIPANSTLIFEVELLDVKKPARTTN